MFSYNTLSRGSKITNTKARKSQSPKRYAWLLGAFFVTFVVLRSVSPVSASSIPSRYTVQPGDTLWTISEKLNASSDVRSTVYGIESLNGLSDSNHVYPGEILEIPTK